MQAAEVSRFGYKSVPESGTKGAGRDSRAHKENGTLSRPVFLSRWVSRLSRCVGVKMEDRKPLASAMPQTAAWVGELRRVLGAEVVDAAMAASQQARREHQSRVQQFGQAQADAWLARQKWPQGRIWLQEGGREVGVRA